MLVGRRIAIIEDDEIMGASLVQRLELEGADTTWWKTGSSAVDALTSAPSAFDAVVCDIRLPDRDGEAVFRDVAASAPPLPFLFLTAHGEIDQAVRLLRAGASDYLTKPFETDEFLARLAAILRPGPVIAEAGKLGPSAAMREVERILSRIASHDLSVLLTGETGVGKEVAARFLHDVSPRSDAPFIAVNCASVPSELFESVFLGHEKGAFTGAHERHAGYLERAAGGTLFLDEIGDMPMPMQAKLLRIIEERHFTRVGGETAIPFSARVVSATNRDLADLVGAGKFRDDLRYRLNAVEIDIPPLRARPEDAIWLLHKLFDEIAPEGLRGVSDLAEEAVLAHDWPGNARELRNRLERAVALAEGEMIGPVDLFPESAAEGYGGRQIEPLAEIRAHAERRQINRALGATGGRVADAAALLGISRTTLWEKMRKLGVPE